MVLLEKKKHAKIRSDLSSSSSLKGYHEETHWRTRSSRDNDGNWVEEREVSGFSLDGIKQGQTDDGIIASNDTCG